MELLVVQGHAGSMSTTTFHIGPGLVSSKPPLNGFIDEFALFSSDVSSDVSNIYNSGTPDNLASLNTTPTHWWQFTQTDINNFPTVEDHAGSIDLTAEDMTAGDYSTDMP